MNKITKIIKGVFIKMKSVYFENKFISPFYFYAKLIL